MFVTHNCRQKHHSPDVVGSNVGKAICYRGSTSGRASPDNKVKKDGAQGKSKMANVNSSIIAQAPHNFQCINFESLNYKQIATEVANLINPAMEKSIERAVGTLRADLNKPTEQLTSQNSLLLEMEERGSSLEDSSSKMVNKIVFLQKKKRLSN